MEPRKVLCPRQMAGAAPTQVVLMLSTVHSDKRSYLVTLQLVGKEEANCTAPVFLSTCNSLFWPARELFVQSMGVHWPALGDELSGKTQLTAS